MTENMKGDMMEKKHKGNMTENMEEKHDGKTQKET